MSDKERDGLKLLWMSERQVRRVLRRHELEGDHNLVHAHFRGKYLDLSLMAGGTYGRDSGQVREL